MFISFFGPQTQRWEFEAGRAGNEQQRVRNRCDFFVGELALHGVSLRHSRGYDASALASCYLPRAMNLPTRRFDPTAAAAARAFLVPQTMVHRHAPSALALWVCRMEPMHAGGGLKLQLRDGCVDDREALLCEHRPIREPQSVDVTVRATRPGPQMANSGGQSVEGLRAFRAEEMQAAVLA